MIIKGRIRDAVTGETLPGANVFMSGPNGEPNILGIGTASGSTGHFLLDLPKGDYVTVSFIGYKRQTFLKTQVPNNIELQPSSDLIDEITLTAAPTNYNLLYIAGACFILATLLFAIK